MNCKVRCSGDNSNTKEKIDEASMVLRRRFGCHDRFDFRRGIAGAAASGRTRRSGRIRRLRNGRLRNGWPRRWRQSGLLLRPDVRGELELLDEQTAELQKLADGMRDQFRDLMVPDENVSWQDRMQRFREVAEKARDEAQQKVDKILLPHQKKRLEQLSNQMRMPGGACAA
jgi:hypothetical protein